MQRTRWLTLAGILLFGGVWVLLSMQIAAEEEAFGGSVSVYPVLVGETPPADPEALARIDRYVTWQQIAGRITLAMAAIHCIVLNLTLQRLQRERTPPAFS